MLKKAIYLTLFLFLIIGGAGCGREELKNVNGLNNINDVGNNSNSTEIGGENETINWLTFRNEKYSYSFEYPEKTIYPVNCCSVNQELDQQTKFSVGTISGEEDPNTADHIDIGWGRNTFLSISFLDNKKRLPLLEFVESQTNFSNPYIPITMDYIRENGGYIEVSKKRGYRFVAPDPILSNSKMEGIRMFLYIEYDMDTMIVITYPVVSGDDDYYNEHRAFFERMLKGWKFEEE